MQKGERGGLSEAAVCAVHMDGGPGRSGRGLWDPLEHGVSATVIQKFHVVSVLKLARLLLLLILSTLLRMEHFIPKSFLFLA